MIKSKQTKKKNETKTILENVYTVETTPWARTKTPLSLCGITLSSVSPINLSTLNGLWLTCCWLASFPEPGIIPTKPLIYRNKFEIPNILLFSSHLRPLLTDNFITPLSSPASCPLLSLLINPSITFLVSFHVSQPSAFTAFFSNKEESIRVCACVSVCVFACLKKRKSEILDSDRSDNTTANSGSSVVWALRSPLGEAQFGFPSRCGSEKGCVSSLPGSDAF